MKLILCFATVILFCASQSINAHEGHNKTPGAIAAPHGGSMKDLEHLLLEMIPDATGVKVYAYTHDLKPLAPTNLKLEGVATFPKKTKGEKVNFAVDGEAFAAKIDTKGAHRYTLDVSVTLSGKKEKTKFSVEPQ